MDNIEIKPFILKGKLRSTNFGYLNLPTADGLAKLTFTSFRMLHTFPNVYPGKNTFTLTNIATSVVTTTVLDTGYYLRINLVNIMSALGVNMADVEIDTNSQYKFKAKANATFFPSGCILTMTGNLHKMFGLAENSATTLNIATYTNFTNVYNFVSEPLDIGLSISRTTEMITDTSVRTDEILISIPLNTNFGDFIDEKNYISAYSLKIPSNNLTNITVTFIHPSLGSDVVYLQSDYTMIFTVNLYENPYAVEKKEIYRRQLNY